MQAHENRSKILPTFRLYRHHPLLCDKAPHGLALVYESSPEFLHAHMQEYSNLKIPQGPHTKRQLYEKGFLELRPNMYIFYRNHVESNDPSKDLLKAWVTPRSQLQAAHGASIKRLDELRDALLGPPDQLNGGKKGGTALERSGRANGNLQGDRCNTFGLSRQSVRNITHPSANMSRSSQSDVKSESSLLPEISETLRVSACSLPMYYFTLSYFYFQHAMILAVSSVMHAPQEWVDLQIARSEVNNLPPVGDDCNKGFFSQMQINLAGAILHDADTGLDIDLGAAGGSHTDGHDDPQSYTCMFAWGNLEEYDIDPGYFFFLELGIFIGMDNYNAVCFSGLHFHCGSAPRCKPGVTTVPKQATRMVCVCYPNKGIMSGKGTPMVAGLVGDRSRVEFVPRFRFDPELRNLLSEGPLNMLRDGASIMSKESHKKHSARLICGILDVMLSQSDSIGLNPDAMKNLFLDKDNNNQVLDYCSDWKYPPGLDDSARARMMEVTNKVEAMQLEVCMSVPQQLHRLYNSGEIELQCEEGSTPKFAQSSKASATRKSGKKCKLAL